MEKIESKIIYSIMGTSSLIAISVLAFFLTNVYSDFKEVTKAVLKIEKNLELLQLRHDIKEQKLTALENKINQIEQTLNQFIHQRKQNEKIR